MTPTYTLYGSHASYYTAKTRAYLRKKGIPFVERLPSDPAFRERVRPVSGSHRIPQLLTPEGEVVQDTVEILDSLERRFPELPAFPATPCQRVFVHLMELLGSQGLVQLAWLHRWLFDENDRFVKMEFGRSFRPQGSDEELLKYGNLIADRMKSYGLPKSTPEFRDVLDQRYCALLERLEALRVEHPYFLGGHPSAADYAVMGALHAHLGRDPAGLRMMQRQAPRTFRWVEHMLVPEVQSPEFFDTPIAYPDDDAVPEPSLAVLRWIADESVDDFARSALAFRQAMQRLGAGAGYEIAPDQDQPRLPVERVKHAGAEQEHTADVYAVWLAQRAQKVFQSQPEDVRARVDSTLGHEGLRALLAVPADYEIARVSNRFVLASAPAGLG